MMCSYKCLKVTKLVRFAEKGLLPGNPDTSEMCPVWGNSLRTQCDVLFALCGSKTAQFSTG